MLFSFITCIFTSHLVIIVMYKFLITIFISSILHFTHANNHCTDNIKVLDPSIGLGTYNCTELGKYQRNGCKRITKSGIVCIFGTKGNTKNKRLLSLSL